ncbi:hypothetical protein [Cereibacter sphaeroides]|uniref:hypothetical protein n=1 Tax=Cereibacter sphaeroides TaxID=1063 RepID=UPI00084772CA|nr:hypothetical protein A9O63_17145 [Cereibacter johrii]
MSAGDMTKEQFIEAFVARCVSVAGPTFDDGSSIADYAREVAPSYWADDHQREDGPEACADADMSYWGED